MAWTCVNASRCASGSVWLKISVPPITAISLAPSAAEPYNGRGVSYLALGDEDNAFADFNPAIKLDEHSAEGWANQAVIFERRGDKARARKSFQQAVKLDPSYGPAVAGLDRTRGS